MCTILMIDDMAEHSPEMFSTRTKVKDLGFAEKFAFAECHSTDEAKKAVKEHDPDILLLDNALTKNGNEGRQIVRWLEKTNRDITVYSTTGSEKSAKWYTARGIPHVPLYDKELLRAALNSEL